MHISKKIAFFAPIKPPDHPIPSGDRLIAQNLIMALKLGGNAVELASRYICYAKRSNLSILKDRKAGALEEAQRIIARYNSMDDGSRPDVWITYHPYCKAPDWIGPIVTSELGIPYLTIEAARTNQGDETDPWKPWREEAQIGIRAADAHIVFKPSDRFYLTELLGSDGNLHELAPYVDLESLADPNPASLPPHWDGQTPVLVTTGMMRKGKKDKNFYMLAEILTGIVDEPWNLVLVGGGPEEENIRAAFNAFEPKRLHWTGQVDQKDVLGWMNASDLFIWPGWKEPIGMVYLEAQSQGLPVIAYNSMGVPLVVEHGVTGLLAPEGDVEAMRDNIHQLLKNQQILRKMSLCASQKIPREHSMEAAAQTLNAILNKISR